MANPIVIIDNGGCTIKAGLAGEDHPSAVVSNVVGLEQFTNLSDRETFENFIDAHKAGKLNLRYPITNGAVTNWDDMEAVWLNVIENHLQISPEEASILITEPISNPKPSREKMAEILLEKIGFSAISIATSPILPLYAVGKMTGIVLNVGDGTTQVVPVWGGYPITDAMQRVDFGGHHITQIFKEKLVNRNNLQGTSSMPFEVFKLIKEKTCFVLPDSVHIDKFASNRKTYEMPNGDNIELGEETYKCPEFLFNPEQFEEEEQNKIGLHQLLYKSIQKTTYDVRKDLYANILLSGGSTLFPGLAERLEKELKALVPASVKIRVSAYPARKYYTWIGGSVMASLDNFPSTLISKKSWEDGSGRNALAKLY